MAQLINLLVLVLASMWLARDPSWEAGIVFVTSLGALAFVARPKSPYQHVYSPDSSQEFYSSIAKYYDSRNSQSLLQCHFLAIEIISNFVADKPSWSVLDLGGGTGKLIATHFFNKAEGKWVLVDFSAGMVEQFANNLQTAKLHFETHIESISGYLNRHSKDTQGHDVVLLSFILSSMSQNPDWALVMKQIKPNGKLIIVDADPIYSSIHPHYAVPTNSGVQALKLRAINSVGLIEEVTRAGFVFENATPIKNNETPYASMLTFKAGNA